MRFLGRSFMGLFLMGLTLALLAWAGSLVSSAVTERMNAEPRSFPQRERVVAVNVVPLEPQTLTPEISTFGEVMSRRILDLRVAAAGTVIEVGDAFVDGGVVAAGDLLLRIDPADAQSAYDRANADLSDAEAEARDAERGLTLARDELVAAQEQSDLRIRALARQRDLQDRGIGTAPELESAELAASAAAQGVLTAREAVAQAQARIDMGVTRIARARIAVSEAQRNLDGTELRAPFDGVLADVALRDGGRVTANERVAQLIDPASLEVAFRLSTSQYVGLLSDRGRLAEAPVYVSLDVSGVDISTSGTIDRESAGTGAGQTGRLIYATLEDALGLRPGDFVTVRVTEPAQDNLARIPAAALAADGTVLIVGEEDRLRVAAVDLVRRQGDDALVRVGEGGDVPDGALVVANRTPILGPGLKVQPLLPRDPDEVAGAIPPPEMIQLDPDRRARIVAYIEGNEFMPQDAKTRLLSQLEAPEVRADVIERIESRMGS